MHHRWGRIAHLKNSLLATILLLAIVAPAAAQEEGGQSAPRGPRPTIDQFTPSGQDRTVNRRRPAQNAPRVNPTQGTVVEGEPARPAGQPAESGDTGRATTQRPRTPALGEFVLRVDENMRMLRHHPAGLPNDSVTTVIMGNELVTELTFENRDELPIDEVRIILSYNPEFLTPVAMNDSVLAPFIGGNPVAEIDHNRGILLYEAQLTRELVHTSGPLFSIRWEPVRVTPETAIEFSRRSESVTAINGRGIDLLGDRRVPGDGTLNLNVRIIPSDPREAQAMMLRPPVFQVDTMKLGDVMLRMIPPDGPVHVGEIFHVDIELDNLAYSMLSTVSLLISYDPNVIEILDADHNNMMTRETNILDGPFYGAFGWDFAIYNRVMRNRGLIAYRVSTSNGEAARGERLTMARIVAVAKRPTQGTPLTFLFNRQGNIHGTAATYLGADVLGNPNIPNDGVEHALITILPPRFDEVASPAAPGSR